MNLVQKEVQKVYMWKEPYTDYSAMQGPCPSGFHVPMPDEVTSIKTILTTFSVGHDKILMPMAGQRAGTATRIDGVGNYGYWWTCELASQYYAYDFSINGQYENIYVENNQQQGRGNNIRPFKDVPVVPDSTRTVLHQGTGDAGIYHNSTLGLISLSTDGTTRITIADKNLGATSTDISSTDSYGYYYQWGNNYGFATTGSVTTSATPVDATGYGPGNYYNSSTFITASHGTYGYYWQSTLNQNLRGRMTGTITGGGDIEIRPQLRTIEYLVVGGGGDGGVGRCGYGGGGGAGGVIQGTMGVSKGTAFNVTVGTASPTCGTTNGANGCPSCLGEDIIAYGGGGGGYGYTTSGYAANAGGSGGGGGAGRTATIGALSSGGATCNAHYGKRGGSGYGRYAGGGGGGYTCIGASATNTSYGGIGGCGLYSCISGAGYWYGSGGSGGGGCSRAGYCGGGCGAGVNNPGGNATTYGSGGGGGSSSTTSYTCYGGKGCKGVVIVRYPTACGYSVSGGTCYTCGDYTIHCFTSNGTLTVN